MGKYFYFCAMIDEKRIDGGTLGEIVLRHNPRARRYLLRIDKGQVIATMPLHGRLSELQAFIEEQRPRWLRLLAAAPKQEVPNEHTTWQPWTFRVHIFCGAQAGFYATNRSEYHTCHLQ